MEGEREVSVFGSDILDALYGRARALGVEFLPDTLFTDLALRDGQVCGAVCLTLATGEIQIINAKAVVLATGGAHNLFASNSGSTDLCGEGQAAAWRAGAELIDMEMISFCPTVTRYPTMSVSYTHLRRPTPTRPTTPQPLPMKPVITPTVTT